jgi:uncharacterized membrane protein
MKQKYTKLQLVLELITILVLIGMYVYLLINWNTIPDQIPGHYNSAGEVNRWGNKSELIALPIISTVLYLLMSVVLLFPTNWNIPAKVTENNIGTIYSNIRYMMILIKLEIITMFFYIMYQGSKAQSLSPAFTPVILILVFGSTAFFLIRVIKASHGK